MSTERSRGQIHQLNWVRAVAALLVVGYHCQLTIAKPKYFNEDVMTFFTSGWSGVQLFFVLSGFVIYISHMRDSEASPGVLRDFAIKRFRRLYPPLWVVLIPVTLLAVAQMGFSGVMAWDIVAAFLILPVEKELILAVEWTLRHEILFYALFALFLWNRRIGLAALILWGILGPVLNAWLHGGWFVDFVLNANHALFLFGMLAGWAFLKAKGKAFADLAVAAGVIVFVATYAVVFLYRTPETDANVLGFGVGAGLVVFGLASSERFRIDNRFMNKAGAASYSLYLIHYPLISILTKIAVIVDSKVNLPSGVYLIGIIIACQIAGILFHDFIEKPTIRFTNRILKTRREAMA